MTKHKAIGIDLGTTNSCVAWVDEAGHTAMVPNAEGDLLTPSVVLFDDAEVVVGKEARNACVVEPSRVAIWVKRDMGAPVYSRPIRGEYLPPEVIQACILRKLRSDVVHALGPESQVVITVPAYFDEPRRKATADAGEMAGLKVLDIVNEPTAGALAFGEVLGYLSPDSAPQRSLTVLVYDLGGGTFDSTLLRLSPGNVQMIATDGDVQLGGYDWDMRVLAHVAEAFKRTHGVDPRNDPSASNRLFREVIDAKHTLSSRLHAKIHVDHAGQHFECEVTRQAFEELTADLLERTTYTTRQLLAAAKLDWKDVDRVLLVGGGTRMPMVPRMLEQISGIRPDHTVNPDEAVARGAALYAHYLLSKTTPDAAPATFEVGNVNAHSLGVEGIEADTLRKRNVILIARNTRLPAKVTQRFATKIEGQQSIVVQVLEGESSLPSECTAIGRTAIRDLPVGLPKGWPVEVTFEYGTNGRLTVRTAVAGTHRDSVLDLERDSGLSREGIARWKQAVSSAGGFVDYESALADVMRTVDVPPPEPAGGHDWALPPAASPAAKTPPAHATPPVPIARPEVAPFAPIATPPTPGAFLAAGTAPAKPIEPQAAPLGPVGQTAGAGFGLPTPAVAWPGQQQATGVPCPPAPQPGPAWQPAMANWQGQPGAGIAAQAAMQPGWAQQTPVQPGWPQQTPVQPGWPQQTPVQPGWPQQGPYAGAMPGAAYPGSPAPAAYPASVYPTPVVQSMPFAQPGPDAWGPPGYGQAPAPANYGAPAMRITPDTRRPEPGVGRKILNLMGHILAAGLGLFIGYLFLSWLRPDLSVLHWLPIHR